MTFLVMWCQCWHHMILAASSTAQFHLLVLTNETVSIIWMLCVGVRSFICPHGRSECLWMIFGFVHILFPMHTKNTPLQNLESVYDTKWYSFFFGDFLQLDMLVCSAMCSQPIVFPMPVPVNALTGHIWQSYWGEAHVKFLTNICIYILIVRFIIKLLDNLLVKWTVK